MSAKRGRSLATYLAGTGLWIPAVVIGLLLLPMVVTHRSFGHDWTLHLWAVRQQQWNIEAMGHPGYFVSARPLGAFYPLFAFVGSGIYSVGGYLAILLGDEPVIAYKLLFLAGLCLAYGGFTWLSVQFGLRGWRSQVPGAVLVTGAYFITDMVGRGDFAEFIAVSSIPFLVAAAYAVLTSEVLRTRYLVAVVVGAFVLSGSHNITLLWGSVFAALLCLVAVLAWAPTWRRPMPWRRVGQLLAVGAVGVGLNAWYLFPDLKYGLDTIVSKVSTANQPGTLFSRAALLLNPFRPADHSPSIVSFFARDIRLSFPILFFAWGFVVALGLSRRRDWAAKRLLLGLIGLTAVFTVFAVARRPWKFVPHLFWNIQFTWRLGSYILLGTALLVMFALVWQAQSTGRVRQATSVALVAIVVFNVGAATWQVWRVRSEYVVAPFEVVTRGHFAEKVVAARHVVPRSWYAGGDFRDATGRVYQFDDAVPMTVPLDKIRGSSFTGTFDIPARPVPFPTNIAGGPRFVRMTGITAVGRTHDGLVVAVRAADAPAQGPVVVTINTADSAVLRGGAIVSVLSLLAFAGVLLWPLWRHLSRSRTASVQ